MPDGTKNHMIILDGAAGKSQDEIANIIKSKADDIAQQISSVKEESIVDRQRVAFFDWNIDTGDITTGDINLGGIPGMFG